MNLSEAIALGVKQLNQQSKLVSLQVEDGQILLLETNGTTLTLAVSRHRHGRWREIGRTTVPYLSTNLISGTMPASMIKLFEKMPKRYDCRQVDDRLVFSNDSFKYTIVLT